MGKRSSGFARVERDFYPTPKAAVEPLLPHLDARTRFVEPCAGDGRLVVHLEDAGHQCRYACDIEPMAGWVSQRDAFEIQEVESIKAEMIITNPPWDRKFLHPFIEHCIGLAPTWLLFDADWMHTKQSANYMPYCSKIVSVGRVKWIEDSKMTGKDNCAWYLFGQHKSALTNFVGR